jgi:hypothetical protein
VQSPSIGSFNTFQARSQATSSIGISDRCTLSAGTTLDGANEELFSPYTVVYGSRSERVVGEKANWEAEENLRIKHLGYLREIIPKYVPIFWPTGGSHADSPDSIVCDRYEVMPSAIPFEKERSPPRYSPDHHLDTRSRCCYHRYAWLRPITAPATH